MKGTVARWFDFRGFDFIKVEGQEHDIFLHSSNVNGTAVPKVGAVSVIRSHLAVATRAASSGSARMGR
jgi:hypothetical protein